MMTDVPEQYHRLQAENDRLHIDYARLRQEIFELRLRQIRAEMHARFDALEARLGKTE
jgi:hypothetical protein